MARESTRRADDFTRIIETANAPIFGTDIDGNVTVWNRKSSELTGFEKQEVIGRKFVANFITPDYRVRGEEQPPTLPLYSFVTWCARILLTVFRLAPPYHRSSRRCR